MRRTMVMVRRLVLLAFATSGLLVVATGPAHAKCPPAPAQAVAPAAEEPAPQLCQMQHCEPVLRD